MVGDKMEGRAREGFSESLLDRVALERVESREGGGGASGKAAVEGECMRDEGRETRTGDEIQAGLSTRASRAASRTASREGSLDASRAAATEARRRL
jgi:hypothetical protein